MGATTKQLQQKLNMANKTVAELMEQNALLIQSNDLHVNENLELCKENEQLKHMYAESEMTGKALVIENASLKDDLVNANSDIEKLIKSLNKVTAENYAHKSEIERTNRHINLAENQLNKEQQPIVVNHYHNCVINK